MTQFQRLYNSTSPHYSTLKDCLFLITITTLSFILYVHNIGFYSDDWAYTSAFFTSRDQSLAGLFSFVYDDYHLMRPIQILYYAVLYSLFGLKPFGYHLTNSIIFTLGVVFLYLALRQLIKNRWLYLSITLIYALLPHYSTDRLWASACIITLSMTLYFVSLYSDLKVAASSNISIFGWKSLSIISMILSTLSYEVFVPFFFLNPLLVFYRRKQSISKHNISYSKLTFLNLTSVIVLISIIAFKASSTVRLKELDFVDQIIWFTSVLKEVFETGYGIYGIGLPIIIFKIIRTHFDLAIFMTGLTTGVIIFVYLYHELIELEHQFPSRYEMFLYLVLGIFLTGLGYAIFLTVRAVQITLAGNGNRTAIAAAVGTAISTVAVIGLVSNQFKDKHRSKTFFAILVSITCICGFIITNTIATYWARASAKQQIVLDKIKANIRDVPAEGGTLLLDGICPYVGPGVVFETSWDTTGALSLIYGKELVSDVIKPTLTFDKQGITTVIYNENSRYPYDNLFVYNFSNNFTYQLKNQGDAGFYFNNISSNYKNICPVGVEGIGVPIFWNELQKNWNTWNYKQN